MFTMSLKLMVFWRNKLLHDSCVLMSKGFFLAKNPSATGSACWDRGLGFFGHHWSALKDREVTKGAPQWATPSKCWICQQKCKLALGFWSVEFKIYSYSFWQFLKLWSKVVRGFRLPLRSSKKVLSTFWLAPRRTGFVQSLVTSVAVHATADVGNSFSGFRNVEHRAGETNEVS